VEEAVRSRKKHKRDNGDANDERKVTASQWREVTEVTEAAAAAGFPALYFIVRSELAAR